MSEKVLVSKEMRPDRLGLLEGRASLPSKWPLGQVFRTGGVN
jgi:hypothetical protein